MVQTVNLTETIDPSIIDNEIVRFNVSAWLGGYAGQNDNAKVLLIFLNQSNVQVGGDTNLGPLLAADRANITRFLFRQATGLVPIGAHSFNVTVTMIRTGGSDNDGSADNIAVSFYQ